MDDNAWVRILKDIAEPILDSADIRQALEQTESNSDTLLTLIANHPTELICSAGNPELDFVERVRPPAFARHWGLTFALCAIVLAIIAAINVAASVVALLLLPFAFYFAWFGQILVFGPRLELEPVGETRQILERRVIGPFLRQQINQLLADREESGIMRVTSAPGLAELSEREQIIITSSLQDLAKHSQEMSSGSIGLSGPRGVGKTTLLRYFCDPSLGVFPDAARQSSANPKDLRIMVSAPVKYNTKDFILHLFERFCESVLEIPPGGGYSGASPGRGGRRRARWWLAVIGGMLAALGIAIVIFVALRPSNIPKPTAADTYLAAAAVMLIAGVAILGQQARAMPLPRRFLRRATDMRTEASTWLTRIRYIQTLTTGYSGSVNLPLSVQAGATTTKQLAEVQLTLPELVDSFSVFAARVIASRGASIAPSDRKRALQEARMVSRKRERLLDLLKTLSDLPLKRRLSLVLTRLTATWERKVRSAHYAIYLLERRDLPAPLPRLVIGIDEIDRISAESAESFLNDIKAIFGIPRCLYLVSVSDEALAVFEQRVLQGRSAFDSTFDEVVRAKELDFESCRELLRRRIAGMPDVLIAFCEVMSGGLPRDLIRTARLVVNTAQKKPEITALVLSIVLDQIAILKRSLTSEIVGGSKKEPTVGNIVRYLIQDDWPGQTMAAVLDTIGGDLIDMPLTTGFKTALYLYATVGQIFTTDLPKTVISLQNYAPDDAGCIDRLAYARNMISVNEEAAWQMVDNFRGARGLSVLQAAPGT